MDGGKAGWIYGWVGVGWIGCTNNKQMMNYGATKVLDL